MNIKKINFKNILDFILVFLLLVLSIKKGGFYKSDTMVFNLIICVIGIIYVILKFIKDIKLKKYKLDIIGVILLCLPVAYLLPVVFENYANLSDSIFEMMRYINLYIIYKIVKNSESKRIYIDGIIIITFIQCLIGIDGIASRYLTDILKIFESGFLSKDLTRISSTIQYANIFGILCTISSIFVIDKLAKIKSENKNVFDYVVLNTLMFVFTTCIILTGSRLVILIYALSTIIYIIMNKKSNINMLLILFINLLLSVICSTIIYQFMLNKTNIIYLIFIATLFTSIIVGIVLYKLRVYFENKEKTARNLSLKKNMIFIGVLLFTIMYLIIGFNFSKDLKITSNSKENIITRSLYNIKSGDNNLNFVIEPLEEDTRYSIILSAVNENFETNYLKNFNYYENSNGNFNFDFKLDESIKYLSFTINVEKGSLKIADMNLNAKKQKLDFYILPAEIVFRSKDFLNGSSSIRDRLTFVQDSIKIGISSPKSFFIGNGGEGFKNLYEQYQEFSYISTEAHSYILQTFVEIGIIGVILILVLVIYVLKNTVLDVKKYVFIIFFIHSMLDLNMSYMFMIAIFGILLGLLERKQKEELEEKISYISESIVFIVFSIFSTIILTRATFAYYINIPQYEKNEITLEKEIDVVSKYEQRTILDNYEIAYKNTLNDEYDKYLQILVKTMEQENISEVYKEMVRAEGENVIRNIKINADLMLEYDKYNKYTRAKVSDIYFKNLETFVNTYYSENKEEGYKKYIELIISNIEFIDNNFKYNKTAKKIVKDSYINYYKELIEKNKVLKSNTLNEAINKLNEKLKRAV